MRQSGTCIFSGTHTMVTMRLHIHDVLVLRVSALSSFPDFYPFLPSNEAYAGIVY